MTNAFDVYFYQLINQDLSSPVLDFLMVKFSDKFFWIPFYCVIIWMLSRQYKQKTLLILLCLGLSVLASDRITSGVMKPYFERVRPCHEAALKPRLPEGIYCSDTGSMASSHAANHFAVAVFMLLLYGLSRKGNVAFWLIWASAVAYSRVYCGVHYPTDVLVGALTGAAMGAATYWIYLKSESRIQWK